MEGFINIKSKQINKIKSDKDSIVTRESIRIKTVINRMVTKSINRIKVKKTGSLEIEEKKIISINKKWYYRIKWKINIFIA